MAEFKAFLCHCGQRFATLAEMDTHGAGCAGEWEVLPLDPLDPQAMTGGERAAYVAGYERALRENAAALALMFRLRQWDMLDAAADGSYWQNEMDKVLLP